MILVRNLPPHTCTRESSLHKSRGCVGEPSYTKRHPANTHSEFQDYTSIFSPLTVLHSYDYHEASLGFLPPPICHSRELTIAAFVEYVGFRDVTPTVPGRSDV